MNHQVVPKDSSSSTFADVLSDFPTSSQGFFVRVKSQSHHGLSHTNTKFWSSMTTGWELRGTPYSHDKTETSICIYVYIYIYTHIQWYIHINIHTSYHQSVKQLQCNHQSPISEATPLFPIPWIGQGATKISPSMFRWSKTTSKASNSSALKPSSAKTWEKRQVDEGWWMLIRISDFLIRGSLGFHVGFLQGLFRVSFDDDDDDDDDDDECW